MTKNKPLYRIPTRFTTVLYETNQLRLEHEFEYTYLINKSNNHILMEDDFYGEPQCCLIDNNNTWAIVAGIHLTLWTPNSTQKYYTDTFKWIHAIRLKNNYTVEILIDPWSSYASIWELCLPTKKLSKISNFKKYQNKIHSDIIHW
ncbi:hypothetical protein [Aquimarina rhabdastrellae]